MMKTVLLLLGAIFSAQCARVLDKEAIFSDLNWIEQVLLDQELRIEELSSLGLALAEARVGLRRNRFQALTVALQRVRLKVESGRFTNRISAKMLEKLAEIVEQIELVFIPRKSTSIPPTTMAYDFTDQNQENEPETTTKTLNKTLLMQNLGYDPEDLIDESTLAAANTDITYTNLEKKWKIQKNDEARKKFLERLAEIEREYDEETRKIMATTTENPISADTSPEKIPQKPHILFGGPINNQIDFESPKTTSKPTKNPKKSQPPEEISCGYIGPHRLSKSAKLTMLGMTNRFRSEIALGNFVGFENRTFAPAKNMRKLRWSCVLEKKAQSWAHGCQMSHASTERRQGQGECLFFPRPPPKTLSAYNMSEMAEAFHNEFKTRITSSPMKMDRFNWKFAGHATQQAWAENDAIGCAAAFCPNDRFWVVCRYSRGNNLGSLVYEEGPPCSQCPPETQCNPKSALCEMK